MTDDPNSGPREGYVFISDDELKGILRNYPRPGLFRSIALEIIDQRQHHVRLQEDNAALRADRVKLQGEIERLTHELAEAHATRPLPPAGTTLAQDRADVWAQAKVWLDVAGKPTDIEALAQRLAKVEDGLASQRERVSRVVRDSVPELNARIDQVCEIIGTRIGGLEERLTELRYMFDQAETRTVNLLDAHSTAIAALKFPDGEKQDGAAFPTGAATTVDEVLAQVEEPGAESEPLKPQRGDRVRLEGAHSPSGRPISDGWYDVIGGDATEFQVHDKTSGELSHFSPWLSNSSPSLKEVRRGAAKLPE